MASKGDDARLVSARIWLMKPGTKVAAAVRNSSGVIAIEIEGDEG